MEEVAGTVKELMREGKVLHFGCRSRRPFHQEGPCRVSGERRSERIRYLVAGTGDEDFSHVGRIGHRFCSVLSAGTRFSGRSRLGGQPFSKADRRATLPRFTPEALRFNMPLAVLVREWAESRGMTPAQFALSWMLSRKPWIAPVPGTTNPAHLDDFLGGLPFACRTGTQEFDLACSRLP